MTTEITSGIKVSVETGYDPSQSHPSQSHYFFSYTITIQNASDYTIQLRRRHWYIFDSSGNNSEVEGEGVLGRQPVLAPGDVYEYTSGCNLRSDMGSMHGVFLVERKTDGRLLEVKIPMFELVMPHKYN